MVGILEKNLEKIKSNIQAEVSGENKIFPQILAVSKKQSEEKVRSLYSLGIKDFAENYLQEALVKMKALNDLDICWHFIGQLQKKKVKDIVGKFEYIHSLYREDVAEKISDKCNELNIIQKVLVQVNIAGEESKLGLNPDQVLIFIHKMSQYKNIHVCGLMVFPPLSESEEENIYWFKEGKKLFQLIKSHLGENFCYLSMGTSQNYHLAFREGANMLRIGESLMGPRL